METKQDKIKLPIGIKIDNDWLYTNLAALFDREDFILDVVKFRAELGLKSPISLNDRSKWISKEIGKAFGVTFPNNSFDNLDSGGKVYSRPETKFTKTINDLCSKYQKPPYFWIPIMNAVLCNKHSSAIPLPLAHANLTLEWNRSTKPEMSIVLYPGTTLKDVEKVYYEQIPKITKEYIQLVLKGKFKIFDTRGNIRRDREWYWLWKHGMGHTGISKKYKYITKQGVYQAI